MRGAFLKDWAVTQHQLDIPNIVVNVMWLKQMFFEGIIDHKCLNHYNSSQIMVVLSQIFGSKGH